MIEGSGKSGHSKLRGYWRARAMNMKYFQMRDDMIFPDLIDFDEKNDIIEKYEYRKMRAEMREMKVGEKKGGQAGSAMAVFELKKETKPGILKNMNQKSQQPAAT